MIQWIDQNFGKLSGGGRPIGPNVVCLLVSQLVLYVQIGALCDA